MDIIIHGHHEDERAQVGIGLMRWSLSGGLTKEVGTHSVWSHSLATNGVFDHGLTTLGMSYHGIAIHVMSNHGSAIGLIRHGMFDHGGSLGPYGGNSYPSNGNQVHFKLGSDSRSSWRCRFVHDGCLDVSNPFSVEDLDFFLLVFLGAN